MKTGSILKRLDAPIRFLSFSLNDWMAYLAPFFIGVLADSICIVPAIGFVLVFMTKRMLKQFPKFYAIRYLYWSLPTNSFNRALRINLPPSSQRIWIK